MSVDVTNRCGSLLNKQIVTWHPHSEPLTRQARGWQLASFPVCLATKEQEVVQGRAKRWKGCVRKWENLRDLEDNTESYCTQTGHENAHCGGGRLCVNNTFRWFRKTQLYSKVMKISYMFRLQIKPSSHCAWQLKGYSFTTVMINYSKLRSLVCNFSWCCLMSSTDSIGFIMLIINLQVV